MLLLSCPTLSRSLFVNSADGSAGPVDNHAFTTPNRAHDVAVGAQRDCAAYVHVASYDAMGAAGEVATNSHVAADYTVGTAREAVVGRNRPIDGAAFVTREVFARGHR